MGAIAYQITSLTIVYSIVYSDADERKHQSSASLTFVRGFHRGPVNSPHKWSVTRKMFPFDDGIMNCTTSTPRHRLNLCWLIFNLIFIIWNMSVILFLSQCLSFPLQQWVMAQKEVIWQQQKIYQAKLTHWGRDKIAAISQTTFSNAFSNAIKMYEFRLRFHWSLFLRFE